jgi:hypothetical protein
MVQPFLTYEITRYRDGLAMVRIYRITDDGAKFHRERLAEYETASKGATASAKREIRKLFV